MISESKNLISEVPKEMTLTKQDKINTLDMLSWASMGATLTSIWQIIIPFALFPLNKAQLFLGIISIIFLIVSIIVLYWSNSGYQHLKKSKVQNNFQNYFFFQGSENPPLQPWHIEGTIYLLSFVLIACYLTCFVGIFLNQGYSWALLAAQGVELLHAQKEASIIINSQAFLIIANIVILIYYIKYSYHLEFTPMHLPSLLGWFLVGYVFMCSMVIGDTNFLPSKIGEKDELNYEEAQGAHASIFWLTIIGILVTLFFLFEQRSIQQEPSPKVRFYFLPFLLLLLLGAMLFINSLDFIYASVRISQELKKDCKATIQSYSQEFIDSIGCPSKYKIREIEGNRYYDQKCPLKDVGIVWENDVNKENSEQTHQISCMSIQCCHLIAEERTLHYKQYFLITLLTSFIGLIGAGHCFDLALQNPNKIKAGPSVYTQGKYILQLCLAFCSIFFGMYLSFKYAVSIPESSPRIKINQMINFHAANYTELNKFSSIDKCFIPVDKNEKLPFKVNYDPAYCLNPEKCSAETQGFFVCLESVNGVFQVLPDWQDKNCRIYGTTVYDSFHLQEGLHGYKSEDQFCALGLQQSLNNLLSQAIYLCGSDTSKITVKMKAKQLNVNFDQVMVQHSEMIHQLNKYKHFDYEENHPQYLPKKRHQSKETQLPSENFTTIELKIINAEDFTPIKKAQISVFIGSDKCQALDQDIFFPIRISHTDLVGKTIMYNLPFSKGQIYNIQVRADGFFYNCMITDQLIAFKTNKVFITLSKLLQQNEYMKALLWYQNPKTILELGVNLLFDEKTQCNVGFFNEECGGARYDTKDIPSDNSVGKEITVAKLTKNNYLFYVRHIPQSPDIKQIIFNKGLSLSKNEQNQLMEDIGIMLESQPKFNLYVQQSLYPVGIYDMPVDKKQEINSTPQDLIWLALCVDGSIGAQSQNPIQHFWEKSDSKKFWQRRTGSALTIPNSKICEEANKN